MIARYRIVNKCRIGQVQVVHDFPKFSQAFRLSQSWVAGFFLGDGTHPAVFMVVCWVDQTVVRQKKQLFSDTTVQGIGITILKICAPAALDQQRITRENTVVQSIGKMAVVWSGCGTQSFWFSFYSMKI